MSGSKCVFTATPIFTVTYDCDNAPAGYTLSGQNCVKTTTQTPTPTPTTVNYCDAGYEINTENNTCTKTVTTTPTKFTTYSCPTGQGYELITTATAIGTTRTCRRTITIAATIPRSCPTGYNPVITVGNYVVTVVEVGVSFTSCRLDRDTTTTPSTP